MHENPISAGLRPRPRWGSLQRSPRSPSWIYGAYFYGEGKEGRGREGEWRGWGHGRSEDGRGGDRRGVL